LKIAHFYNGIYFSGGVSAYIQSLSEQQIAAGNEVLYFELTPTTSKTGGIRPVQVADEEELFKICRAQYVDVLHYHKFASVVPPADINAVYTVHEHTPHCLSGGLFLKRRQMPCPRTYNFFTCSYGVIRDHCSSRRPHSFIDAIKRVHVQQAVTPSLKVVCVGHFLKDRMVKAGYAKDRIRVIPNFTDILILGSEMASSSVAEFLFIGRLEKLKGIEWLLRSFKETRLPSILNICGEGTDEQRLRAMVKDFQLEDRVKFHGWIDRETKIDMLRACRALIVPSLWPETFGLVAIEAAGCARPVIASNAGELPYIIENGHNGLVVDVGKMQALSIAIDDLAGNPEKAKAMGLNNQQKLRDLYTAEIHMRQIDEVYASRI